MKLHAQQPSVEEPHERLAYTESSTLDAQTKQAGTEGEATAMACQDPCRQHAA
jgi:hypothetical protein